MKLINNNIRHLSQEELIDFLKKNNEKAFVAKQINEWIWKKSCTSFSDMSNISKRAQKLLEDNFIFNEVSIASTHESSDDTSKYSFLLYDNNFVEGVLIPTKTRVTACVSSQVGCPVKCDFCATGKSGYKRNLFYDEIFDQIAILNAKSLERFNTPLSNIVYMGMGEPLLNFDNVLKSIEIITSSQSFGMSPSRITLSTIGIPDMIKQLGDRNIRFNLALSLHTTNEEKRASIIPYHKKNTNLKEIANSIIYFHKKTNKRISYEYTLLKGFNDSIQDAQELADFCKITPCKINIIEYNSVVGSPYTSPDKKRSEDFVTYLEKCNLIVNVRRSRGKDIKAACGQLVYKIDRDEE